MFARGQKESWEVDSMQKKGKEEKHLKECFAFVSSLEILSQSCKKVPYIIHTEILRNVGKNEIATVSCIKQ